jgi:hypothetical protein
MVNEVLFNNYRATAGLRTFMPAPMRQMPPRRATTWKISPGISSTRVVNPSLCPATPAMMAPAQTMPAITKSPPMVFKAALMKILRINFFQVSSYLKVK